MYSNDHPSYLLPTFYEALILCPFSTWDILPLDESQPDRHIKSDHSPPPFGQNEKDACPICLEPEIRSLKASFAAKKHVTGQNTCLLVATGSGQGEGDWPI